MARPTSREDASELSPEDVSRMFTEMVLLSVPMHAFKKLADAAAARGMTVPDLLTKAVDQYIKSTGPEVK